MIYVKLFMDYKHKHHQRQGKLSKAITNENPLIAIVVQNSFMHFTIEHVLKIHSIPFQIKTVAKQSLTVSDKVMRYKPPVLLFHDEALEHLQVSDFVAHICLAEDEYEDFMARRAIIHKMVESWTQIFEFEGKKNKDFSELRRVGVTTENDYRNYVLQELVNLSILFKGKELAKSYKRYSATHASPENIIFVDIIQTIIRECPESYCDFYLRAYLAELIDISAQIRQRIGNANPLERMMNHEILLEQQPAPKPEWALLSTSANKFLILMGIVTGVYSYFVEK